MSETPAGRRRSLEVPRASLRRRGLLVIGGLLVPAATVASVLVVRPASPDAEQSAAPSRRPLVSQQLVCPPSLPDGTPRLLLSTGEGAGEVGVRAGDVDPTSVSLSPHVVGIAEPEGPVVVDARGEVAPGLFAARVDGALGSAVACRPPRPTTWLTGLGAGSERRTVLHLTNPDGGPAIADVALYGPDGPVEVDDLRGLTIPGRDSVTIDLGEVAPTRETLTAEVTAARGRVGTQAIETTDGRARWLTPESGPADIDADDTDPSDEPTTLLGLPRGDGERTLSVTNPSDDQVRVSVRVVGPRATYDPEGFEEIPVPPGATVTADLTDVVGDALETADGAEIGLSVGSSTPVTAALTSAVDGGLDRSVDGGALTRAYALLPRGSATAVFTAAEATSVTVEAYDEEGERVERRTLDLPPGGAGSLDLPDGTASVAVASPEAIHGALRSDTDGGPVTLPLTQQVGTGLVPQVALGR